MEADPAAVAGMSTATALIVMIIVGAIAGWLAGVIMKGSGYGLVGDIIIGILGGVVGGWILRAIGLSLGGGIRRRDHRRADRRDRADRDPAGPEARLNADGTSPARRSRPTQPTNTASSGGKPLKPTDE